METKENSIPKQEKGAQTDTSSHTDFETEAEAKDFFKLAKNRLIDVSHWDKICGKVSSKFILTDKTGIPVQRLAVVGDLFRIDIPAPGTDTGDGHDWVQIESIDDKSNSESETEFVAIKVRPASNPQNKDADTAHFFKDDATSTFLVERKGKRVQAEVHGRNETPNTETHGVLDTIRNTVVALGAMAGFSTPQWKSLVSGLVDRE